MFSETAVIAAPGAAAMVLACMGGLSAQANTDHATTAIPNGQRGAPVATRTATRLNATACPPRTASRGSA
ncbi:MULTISPECIES: hypothetical protein [Actinoalloteichus]|uniref:Uncharacterized protein n=1 Tax=Actinoalloteichus caeruleus DSM 43889 TaxID=1120930 RepID=A0ABT1JQ00_ACTCY|nr:hypothetical protein [Actinoalloteichus caeruleus]MCP2334213.1 hypothetical protein [Actinoalloteichus caeruleus DSM 43889]